VITPVGVEKWDAGAVGLVDNQSCVIVGVQATAARMSQETVAAQDMLARFAQWQGREPESVAPDTTYGNGEFLQWLADRNIVSLIFRKATAIAIPLVSN